MKKTHIISIIILLFFVSCQQKTTINEKNTLLEQIKQSEQKSFNDSTLSYNKKETLNTINLYQKFIEQNPEDSLSTAFLYQCAQLSKSIDLYGEAIHNFKVFIERYPNNKNTPKAMFLIGLIYENDIKNKEEAKKAYQDFIEKYPNDELTDDAQTLLQYLSLSDEELLNVLIEKNKELTQKEEE